MSNSIEEKFIAFLEKMVSDKAAMADLRRGLGKSVGTTFEMDRYILPFISENTYKHKEKAYYIVASLFALWHHGKDSLVENAQTNLGRSLWSMVKKAADEDMSNRKYEDKWKDAEKKIEKRLLALLNCNKDDLPYHLRHTINLLKAKDIPINWLQLFLDIENWNADDRRVQHNWSKGFWGYTKPTETRGNLSSMDEE
ncbi:MAG: type I-E CRISPR-associated protein Cse2/CasB [Dehalococcoidales bacterium]|nr:type I-E CRISPR-associated protein Cse2/CasB [Dehalococcoidales bacterium]